jgi:AAA+ ATPase superfamily predicted ATPase
MIVGREKEQRELLSLIDKAESQFCAVYGRMRIYPPFRIR